MVHSIGGLQTRQLTSLMGPFPIPIPQALFVPLRASALRLSLKAPCANCAVIRRVCLRIGSPEMEPGGLAPPSIETRCMNA